MANAQSVEEVISSLRKGACTQDPAVSTSTTAMHAKTLSLLSTVCVLRAALLVNSLRVSKLQNSLTAALSDPEEEENGMEAQTSDDQHESAYSGESGYGGVHPAPAATAEGLHRRSRRYLDPLQVRSGNITTLMLSNLNPACTTVGGIKHDLDACGFQDSYDFIYLPHSIARLEVLGYCFINFTTSEAAADFASFYQSGGRAHLQAAKEQGLKRLIALCVRRGLHKLRSDKYRPWLKDPCLLSAQ